VFARAEGRVVPPPNLDGIPDLVARSLELEPAKRPTSVELATALQRGSTPNANRKR
jgi:hypothetical protein